MPCILINYVDHRAHQRLYRVHEAYGPWNRTYEISVGAALTVDVFFKSGTQETRIKTFKFKTQKERRVAVTVTVDVNNTVTAKLVTLVTDEINSNSVIRGGTIITLYPTGMSMAYKRTSERQIYPMASWSIAPDEYLDASAVAAMAAVPPNQAAAVYILPFTACHEYTYRKRMVQALESAGYSNVGCIEHTSPLLSAALKFAKLNNQVGEYVGIGEAGKIHVVRKTDHGYDYVQVVVNVTNLCQLFPTIKEIITFSHIGIDDDQRKTLEQNLPLPLKFVTLGLDYFVPYMWNKHDGGNMDGYLVTMTVQCKFRISYNGKNTVLDARTEMLPWQKTVENDIGDATTVDVFMEQDEAYHGEVHVKQFKFKTIKHRTVSISIAVDDARLPAVKLTTL